MKELSPLQNVMPSLPGQAAEQTPERDGHDVRVAIPAIGVPLLFGENKTKQFTKCCSGRRRGEGGRVTVKHLETIYPMYVIHVPCLVELDRMEPHQDILKKNLLQAWFAAMSGRIIFVSHEWLGWTHADPNSEQFQALKRILQRLMGGEVPKVESYWVQQLYYKQKTIVTAAQWKVALLHMFVWFDFISIPQTCAASGPASNEYFAKMNQREANSSDESTPSYYKPQSSLTASQQKIVQDLKKAVESIPAYVERAALLLVLVPVPLLCSVSSVFSLCSHRSPIRTSTSACPPSSVHLHTVQPSTACTPSHPAIMG